jgi:uncharacterized protein involved in tolerance to divalent cations
MLLLCLCSCPRSHASAIVDDVVRLRLAATVFTLPGAWALHPWRDDPVVRDEATLLAVVPEPRAEAFHETVAALHPEQRPVIVYLPVEAAPDAYLDLVAQRLGVSREG